MAALTESEVVGPAFPHLAFANAALLRPPSSNLGEGEFYSVETPTLSSSWPSPKP